MLGSLPSHPGGGECSDTPGRFMLRNPESTLHQVCLCMIYYPFLTYKIQSEGKRNFRPQTKDLNNLPSGLEVQPLITADCFSCFGQS